MITLKEFIKKELLQLKRDKRMLPIVFIAPILMLVIIGYAITFDVKNVPIVICDLDNSDVSREFIQKFQSSEYFNIISIKRNLKSVDRYLDESLAKVILVIPKDFDSKIASGQNVKVQVLADGTDAYSTNVSLGYISIIAFNYNKNILLDYLNQNGISYSGINIDPQIRVWFNPELKSSKYFIPGIIGLLLTVITVILTSLAIVKEKEFGTMEQLIVTPIKKWELILGKLIPYIVIGFIDVLIVILASFVFFKVEMKGSLILLLFSCIPFLFSTLGLGLVVSTISRTQQQAMIVAVFLILLPFIYLSGFTFPVENMPPVIQFVTQFMPLKYFLIILRSIFLKGSGLDVLWDEILIMFLIGIIIFCISLILFRKQLD